MQDINLFYVWLICWALILTTFILLPFRKSIKNNSNNKQKWEKPENLKEITGKKFNQETVVLKGRFINCEFRNCTLQYEGDYFELYKDTNKLYKGCRFKFCTPESSTTANLINNAVIPFVKEGNDFEYHDPYGIKEERPKIEIEK